MQLPSQLLCNPHSHCSSHLLDRHFARRIIMALLVGSGRQRWRVRVCWLAPWLAQRREDRERCFARRLIMALLVWKGTAPLETCVRVCWLAPWRAQRLEGRELCFARRVIMALLVGEWTATLVCPRVLAGPVAGSTKGGQRTVLC